MKVAPAAGALSAATQVAACAFMYDHCDIPPGMTIDEFRRLRAINAGRRPFRGPLKRLRSG